MSLTQIFALISFIIINFIILTFVKKRVSTVISLIISHLVAVLFFSVTIANYNSFREITLMLVIYSMTLLFLISNKKSLSPNKIEAQDNSKKIILPYLSFAILAILVFGFCFFLTKNVAIFAEQINDKKLENQSSLTVNQETSPVISGSHAAHTTVKKFYLGKKFNDKFSDKFSEKFAKNASLKNEISDRKKARLKDKLSSNFLLKHYCEAMLIISSQIAILLLLNNKIKQSDA